MVDGLEEFSSEGAYFRAIQDTRAVEAARDRAYERQAAATGPVSRFVSNILVGLRDRQLYDSEEHLGMIEELRALDTAHSQQEYGPLPPQSNKEVL